MLAARLNQQALLPDMMFPTVNRFNPYNGRPLPTTNGALSYIIPAMCCKVSSTWQAYQNLCRLSGSCQQFCSAKH